MATYNAGEAKVAIRPDASDFARDLAADLERIQIEYDVNITADLTEFRARMDALRQESHRITVDVDVDTLTAEARLAALTRNRRVTVDVDSRGLSGVSGAAGAATRSLSAMSGVKFGALFAGIAALIPVLGGVAGAAGAAAGALGAVGAAGIIGSGGMIDAFSSMGESATTAGGAAVDASDAIADAQRGVRDAQRDVADAERDALDAQRDLNDSYEDASRYLRDMNDQLVDAELNQESAEIALARAQERQMQVLADPRSSRLDRAEAQNRVDIASQRLKESKSETADQREDTAEANRKGIGGSDIVNEAKRRADDANQRVVEAQERLARATEELAKAGQQGATGAAGVDKFAEALAKLSPNAQDFVLKMQALGPAWTQLRLAVQDNLFAGLGDSVTQFAQQNLPGLQAGLSQVATYMNSTFKETLSGLSTMFQQLSADGTMQAFVQSIGSMMSGVAPLITGLSQGIIQMTTIAGPALGGFFQALGGLFAQIGPALGQLGAFLAGALTQLAPALGDFIVALANGLGPVLPVIATLLTSLGNALTPLIPPLSQVLQVIGTALAQAIDGLAPAIGPLGNAFAALVSALAPILPLLGQVIGQLVAALAPALTQVFTAFAPFILQLTQQLSPIIPQIVQGISQMAQILADYLVSAVQSLMPLIIPFVKAFLDLMVAISPLLPQLMQLAVNLLPFLLIGVRQMLPPLTVFMNLLAQLANTFLPMAMGPLSLLTTAIGGIGTVLQWLQGKWNEIWQAIGDFIPGVVSNIQGHWNTLVTWITGLPQRIKTATAGMWDGIKDAFKTALNWIIDKWNGFEIKIGGWKIDLGPAGSIDLPEFKIPTPDIPRLAAGGQVSGPGGPREDKVPAMLSNGEYVVQAAAVNRYGVGFFDRANAMHLADGGLVGTYGLPPGTNTGGYGSGGDVFPKWIHDLEKHGVKPSTYAGHQEGEGSGGAAYGYTPNPQRLNRGVDWVGSVDAMQKFAEYLMGLGPSTPTLEQVIWQNPNTGQKLGWAGRRNVSGDDPYYNYPQGYPDHQNHVHTRFNGPVPMTQIKATVVPPGPNQTTPNPYDNQDGRNDPQKYAPSPDAATQQPEQKPYPTTWSGWAGFAASNFFEGQTKSLLGVLGINDSAPGMDAYNEYQNQVKNSKQNQQNPNGQTPNPNDQTQTPNGSTPSPSQPGTQVPGTYTPPPQMPTNVPEGGIADGTPGAKAAVFAVWQKLGWIGNQWLDTLRLGNGESGWRVDATNPSSGAYGLGQFLGEDKKQRWPGYFTPNAEAQAGPWSEYIKERYKTPSQAWAFWQAQSPHWYHDGGPVLGVGDVPSWLEGGEYVVRREAARENMPLLETINSRRPLPGVRAAAPVSRAGAQQYRDHVEWHIQTMPEDAMAAGRREEDRRQSVQMLGV